MIFLGTSVVIGTIVLIVAGAIWEGYALSILWGWFVTPIFGLRSITISEAIAVALIVGMVAKPYVPPKENDNLYWFYVLAKPAVCLLAGWIVLKFM